MKFNITDRGSVPKIHIAEPSGFCIVAHHHTPEVCPLGGSELASILRKAYNA